MSGQEFLSVDRTAARYALANLSPDVGNGWLGVFDPSEIVRKPEVTGNPSHPRCWLTYQIMQWTPEGTFEMPAIGPLRKYELHLTAWCEPVGGADVRDAVIAAALVALAAWGATAAAANHIHQVQVARSYSIDEAIEGYLYAVTIVPSWGGCTK